MVCCRMLDIPSKVRMCTEPHWRHTAAAGDDAHLLPGHPTWGEAAADWDQKLEGTLPMLYIRRSMGGQGQEEHFLIGKGNTSN